MRQNEVRVSNSSNFIASFGRHIFSLSFVLFLLPSLAFARFLDEDRDEVDREELLNTENFNDEISYRPPIYWEHIFDTHPIAFRVNGGSYNARRFMYEEDIKLISPPDKIATFSFLQERQQNLLGNFNDRHLRATWHGLRPVHVSMLADGDSWKKNGDLGMATAYEFSNHQSLEVYYWSVNHMYNTKKDKGSLNKITRATKTWGGIFQSSISEHLFLRIKAELDTPLEFEVLDENYYYEYDQQNFSLLLSKGSKASGHFWDIRMERSLKNEAKTFVFENSGRIEKSLFRRTDWIEGRYSYGSEHQFHWTTGILYLSRDANYTWQVNRHTTPDQIKNAPESESPSIRRDETGVYTTYLRRFNNQSWRNNAYQLGLFFNTVRLNRGGSVQTANELKLQTAWTYLITDTVQMFWNATFNLDGLYRDYPYNRQKFSPWDGGALNIIAAF